VTAEAVDTGAAAGTAGTVLLVRGACFGFGGVAALTDVDLEVAEAECVALIGPNGAGKSTLINCVTQLNQLQRGSVRIDGRECVGLHPSQLIRLGVKRTFQNIETFRDMTVREILEVGGHHLGATSVVASVFGGRRVAAERVRIEDAVHVAAQSLGIEGLLATRVSSLPYGVQKRVDLARALVGGARLLLLDEPAAGLADDEWPDLIGVLHELTQHHRLGILLIEHQLGFVRQLAQRLYALDAGRVVVHGDPASVLADPRVVQSYLGAPAA
jgi:branched-chain amino acid transport system ATP-binding protein